MKLEGNRTFILTVLAIVGAVVLMAIGVIPEKIGADQYIIVVGPLLGIYGGKSALATRKNGGA